MKFFIVFGLIASTSLGASVERTTFVPHYGDNYDPYNPVAPEARPGCRTVAVTDKSVIYVESEKLVCNDVQATECGTCVEEIGADFAAGKIKGFNQCKFQYKSVDVKLDRSITVFKETTECHDIPQPVCQSHWKVDSKGDKVWVPDPTTCKTFEVTKCSKIKTKGKSGDFHSVTVQKPYEICCEVVREHCIKQHSKEPQQQTLTRYEEICDVTYAAKNDLGAESVEFVQ